MRVPLTRRGASSDESPGGSAYVGATNSRVVGANSSLRLRGISRRPGWSASVVRKAATDRGCRVVLRRYFSMPKTSYVVDGWRAPQLFARLVSEFDIDEPVGSGRGGAGFLTHRLGAILCQ